MTPSPKPRRTAPPRATTDATAVAAAGRVGALWRELNQNEPFMMELLLPAVLRDALNDLAKVTAR